MANPVDVSKASRAALRASRLFSAEEIDTILDLRGPSGSLNWRFLVSIGLIDMEKWLSLLRRNLICGVFEEMDEDFSLDEEEELPGPAVTLPSSQGASGGIGGLVDGSVGWRNRMEERLAKMEGTAQAHEQLLVAHSRNINTQQTRLTDVIEFLAESEVGDRNRMMDLLRRQCGLATTVEPTVDRHQNVLDWTMQHATPVDDGSSAAESVCSDFSHPRARGTIPVVASSSGGRVQRMVGSQVHEGQGMFMGQSGTLGTRSTRMDIPLHTYPRGFPQTSVAMTSPVSMVGTVVPTVSMSTAMTQAALRSTQSPMINQMTYHGYGPRSYGDLHSTPMIAHDAGHTVSTQEGTYVLANTHAPPQSAHFQPMSVPTPVYQAPVSATRFPSNVQGYPPSALRYVPNLQSHHDGMSGHVSQTGGSRQYVLQPRTPVVVEQHVLPAKMEDRKTDSGVSSSCAEGLEPRSRRTRRSKGRSRVNSRDGSCELSLDRDGHGSHDVSQESRRDRRQREKDKLRTRKDRTPQEVFLGSSEDEQEVSSRVSYRSSALPKLQAFDGRATHWEAFIFQFENLARSSGWNKLEKLNNLQSCLRGKAVTFVRSRSEGVRSSYRLLVKALQERYGVKELPGVARRQVLTMKQEEGESIEDFADKILNKVSEGFPEVDDEVLQGLAVDAFLRGCRDRSAAFAAAEKEPDRMQDAVKEVRASAANLRAFGKSAVLTRQISYTDGASTEVKISEKLSRQQIADVEKLIKEKLKVDKQSSGTVDGAASSRNYSGTTSGTTSRTCYRCGDDDHMVKDCPAGENLCYRCKQVGHISRECPKRKGRAESGAGKKTPDARQQSEESGN